MLLVFGLLLLALIGSLGYAFATRPPAERLGVRSAHAGKGQFAMVTDLSVTGRFSLSRRSKLAQYLSFGQEKGGSVEAAFDEQLTLLSAQDDVRQRLREDGGCRARLLALFQENPKLQALHFHPGKLRAVFRNGWAVSRTDYEQYRAALADLATELPTWLAELAPESESQVRARRSATTAPLVAVGLFFMMSAVPLFLPQEPTLEGAPWAYRALVAGVFALVCGAISGVLARDRGTRGACVLLSLLFSLMLLARGADRVVDFLNSCSTAQSQTAVFTFKSLDRQAHRKAPDEYYLLLAHKDGAPMRYRISSKLHFALQHPVPGSMLSPGQPVTVTTSTGLLGLTWVADARP